MLLCYMRICWLLPRRCNTHHKPYHKKIQLRCPCFFHFLCFFCGMICGLFCAFFCGMICVLFCAFFVVWFVFFFVLFFVVWFVYYFFFVVWFVFFLVLFFVVWFVFFFVLFFVVWFVFFLCFFLWYDLWLICVFFCFFCGMICAFLCGWNIFTKMIVVFGYMGEKVGTFYDCYRAGAGPNVYEHIYIYTCVWCFNRPISLLKIFLRPDFLLQKQKSNRSDEWPTARPPRPSGVPQSFQCLASREGHAGYEIGPGTRVGIHAVMLRWIFVGRFLGKVFQEKGIRHGNKTRQLVYDIQGMMLYIPAYVIWSM